MFNRLVGFCVLLFGMSAHAFSLSPVGVWTASTGYSGLSLSNASSVMGFGGGALWSTDLAPFLTSEMGALFVTHGFQPSSGNTVYYNTMQIPLLLRFNPIPFLSVGLGGYGGIALSTNFTGSATDASVLAVYTGGTRHDYGLLGAIGFKIAMAPFIRLRVDGIYEWGLANISSGTSSQNSRNFNLLAGLQFDLG